MNNLTIGRAPHGRAAGPFGNLPALSGASDSLATIVGGIATSHTPTIGFALDTNKQKDAVWAPIFEGYKPVQQWLADKKPDVLFFIANDHITSFFFDHYSHFALGVGEKYWVADEGGGPRKLPAIQGHPALARHVANGLVADEFDLSYFQGKGLDHGFFSPLSLLLPHDKGSWPAAMVPLQVGVLEFPIPSAKRCFNLGKSLRKAIESYPEDLKVAIIGTGGLSHQVHGERCGFNNTPWDMEFLERLEKDPEGLTEHHHRGIRREGWLRRLRSDHVADHAWRALEEGEEAAPGVLPAVDDADRDGHLRERFGRSGHRVAVGLPHAHQQAVGRHREAAGHLSVHAGSQREELPPQHVPARADQAGVPQAVPRGSRSRCSSSTS